MLAYKWCLIAVTLAAGACGGSSDDGGDSSLCVEDSREPGACAVKWMLLDPCPLLPQATTIEAAVFAGACPPDATLESGDVSGALETQTVAPTEPITPVKDLGSKTYGFAFLARNASCNVVAYGCTEADLTIIRDVRTAVRNWSSSDTCVPGTLGSC